MKYIPRTVTIVIKDIVDEAKKIKQVDVTAKYEPDVIGDDESQTMATILHEVAVEAIRTKVLSMNGNVRDLEFEEL